MEAQDKIKAQEIRKKIEELNWIFSQIREGLNKVKQAREEQENERV